MLSGFNNIYPNFLMGMGNDSTLAEQDGVYELLDFLYWALCRLYAETQEAHREKDRGQGRRNDLRNSVDNLLLPSVLPNCAFYEKIRVGPRETVNEDMKTP